MSKYLSENQEIGDLIRQAEDSFVNGTGTIMSKYVVNDLYEDINKIYAYLNSKHITGEKDSLGRDKPFFNIVLAARNIYYRATDIDRKDITVTPDNMQDEIPALFATGWLENWMRREDFGTFLNHWGMVLAEFNEAIVKFVESEGELHSMVVPWSRIICDPINFYSNPKIEIIELTEAELYGRVKTHGYDKEIVDKLCDALQARELLDKTQQDGKIGYIKLYELHGNLELSMLTGDEKDDDEYVQQMHVVSFVAGKEKGKFDDFTLVSGREAKDPYMLTALLPSSDGSITLNGSVKNLFQAQWMMNHSIKSIKDQLDLASKLIFQTSDATFVGRNAVTAIQNGDILIHKENMPLTMVNNGSHDVQSQQSFMNSWKSLSNEINGVSESMLGNTAPSGTAWKQVEALLGESHSLFELMTENKGLDIERMLREYVIPFAKKKMKNKDEILARFNASNLAKIDRKYIPAQAVKNHNQDFKNAVLNNQEPQPFDQAQRESAVQQSLSTLGNARPLSPGDVNWDELFKDLEWKLDINITGETSDKQAVLTTLNTTLGVIMNPAYATNPQAQMVVAKALEQTGIISPLELSTVPPPAPALPAQVGGQ